MSSEIDALMGIGIEDPRQLAEMLRRNAYAGDVMAGSTIKEVARGGMNDANVARAGAKQAGGLIRSREAAKQTQDNWQAGQDVDKLKRKQTQDNWQAGQDKTAAKRKTVSFHHPEDRKKVLNLLQDTDGNYTDIEKNPVDLNMVGTLEPWKAPYTGGLGRNKGGHTGSMGKIEKRNFEELGADIAPVAYAIEGYKPEFSKPTLLGMDMEGMPLVNSAENWAANNASVLTNDSEEEKATWWAGYRKFYELMERHKFFGAALTPTEQASWKAANINESMEAEDIQIRLNAIMNIKDRALIKAGDIARLKGASNEYIDMVLGNNMLEEEENMDITTEEFNALVAAGEDKDALLATYRVVD